MSSTACNFTIRKNLRLLEDRNRVVFRYAQGTNPNGAINDIAGIINEAGNVMGMMPHPERASERILTVDRSRNIRSDAITIFWSLVSNLKQKAIS